MRCTKATPSSPITPISAAAPTRRTWPCSRPFFTGRMGRFCRQPGAQERYRRSGAGELLEPGARDLSGRSPCAADQIRAGLQTSKDIEAVLGCNSRTPELVVGDLRGQVGAARLGEKRFQEMMERYGKETILSSFESSFALTEAKVRAEIASWPDGVGEGERFVDSDGIELDKPVRLHVEWKKRAITCSSTSPARRIKPKVRRISVPRSCARPAAICSLAWWIPLSPSITGLARCIEIKVREGQRRQSALPRAGKHLQSDRSRTGGVAARSIEPNHAA